eukprot:TRINITY_DN27119_c0_g1_i3.p2 TRINITY_DN27119_c0_g1~~TRINITY_DN27119_c0_g1_i3.p2  ORF type:complete len:146 (-),score=14.97 TRINITY_DN27119_c0_g1_i3:129-566(-)
MIFLASGQPVRLNSVIAYSAFPHHGLAVVDRAVYLLRELLGHFIKVPQALELLSKIYAELIEAEGAGGHRLAAPDAPQLGVLVVAVVCRDPPVTIRPVLFNNERFALRAGEQSTVADGQSSETQQEHGQQAHHTLQSTARPYVTL